MDYVVVILVLMNCAVAWLLWRLTRDVHAIQSQVDYLSGRQDPVMEDRYARGWPPPPSRPGGILPPPAPPPGEDPSPYSLSSLPDELAAELEAEERATVGSSSKLTCSWWTEQDERDAELEDSYTSDLARRIRALAGDEG